MKIKAYKIGAGGAVSLLAPGGTLKSIDLNELLTRDVPDPIVLQVVGESNVPEIPDGSWVIASRKLAPQPGDVVVAQSGDELELKRLEDIKKLRLVPSNGDHGPKILATVTKVIISVSGG